MLDKIPQLESICRYAGELILAYYAPGVDLGIDVKSDETPVTRADRASDAYLREALQAVAPFPVLSEETVDDGQRFGAEAIWLVDPLDGTKDFIAGTDDFAINIAVIQSGRPALGLIYLPVHRILYYAALGQGAYRRRLDPPEAPVPLSTLDRADHLVLLKSRFSPSEAHEALVHKHRERIQSIEIVGSCLKGCRIAEGRAQGYYRFGLTSEWDTAPMDLIVHEAGGYLRQMDGTVMLYNRQDVVNRQGFYVVSGPKADLMQR